MRTLLILVTIFVGSDAIADEWKRFPSPAELLLQDQTAGVLVFLTVCIQVPAQISGSLPGMDVFRVERVVQFPGQHFVLLGSHSTACFGFCLGQ
jgi:hypothetical protein